MFIGNTSETILYRYCDVALISTTTIDSWILGSVSATPFFVAEVKNKAGLEGGASLHSALSLQPALSYPVMSQCGRTVTSPMYHVLWVVVLSS